MEYSIGDIIQGKVINVKPYALFLEFNDKRQGLLHISEISDAYIKDIEKFGSKNDIMNVKVLSVDKNNGFLRVSLKQVPQDQQYNTHSNSKRLVLNDDENEFELLKEKMPIWIEETIKNMGD